LTAAFTDWLDRRADEKIRQLRMAAESRRRERELISRAPALPPPLPF
jgi:hypothetical protein